MTAAELIARITEEARRAGVPLDSLPVADTGPEDIATHAGRLYVAPECNDHEPW